MFDDISDCNDCMINIVLGKANKHLTTVLIFLLPFHYIDSIKPGKRPHTPFVVGGGHTLTSWAWQRIWELFGGWFLKIDVFFILWPEWSFTRSETACVGNLHSLEHRLPFFSLIFKHHAGKNLRNVFMYLYFLSSTLFQPAYDRSCSASSVFWTWCKAGFVDLHSSGQQTAEEKKWI